MENKSLKVILFGDRELIRWVKAQPGPTHYSTSSTGGLPPVLESLYEDADEQLERLISPASPEEGRRLRTLLDLAGGLGDVDQAQVRAPLLVAVGRAPNVEGLGLETVGVEFGKKGVKAK